MKMKCIRFCFHPASWTRIQVDIKFIFISIKGKIDPFPPRFSPSASAFQSKRGQSPWAPLPSMPRRDGMCCYTTDIQNTAVYL